MTTLGEIPYEKWDFPSRWTTRNGVTPSLATAELEVDMSFQGYLKHVH